MLSYLATANLPMNANARIFSISTSPFGVRKHKSSPQSIIEKWCMHSPRSKTNPFNLTNRNVGSMLAAKLVVPVKRFAEIPGNRAPCSPIVNNLKCFAILKHLFCCPCERANRHAHSIHVGQWAQTTFAWMFGVHVAPHDLF